MSDEFRSKIIYDPVHGEIPISAVEHGLIDSPSFQRLRNLKQLGLASLVYPNATHTRFAHSLGVFRIMSRVIELLVGKGHFNADDKRKMRIAALLHDIGHYPYSHLMEFIDLDKYRPLYLGETFDPTRGPFHRYPDHEKIGQIVITKRKDIASVLESVHIDPEEIAKIIRSEHTKPAYNRLIHSSLDMDRMDYLLRDSLGTGVPYGRIDLDYLLTNLDLVEEDGDVVVSHKAATAAEHFLIARYFMHKTVYFHKTTFGLEALLRQILYLLRKAGHIYQDGKNIEAMIETDEFLNFHDGYVDAQIQQFSSDTGNNALMQLCKALKERKSPKLLHQVSVLQDASQKMDPEYALFTKDRVTRMQQLAEKHDIPIERWIWEDPKDIKFESVGPFVSLADASDLKPGETAEMIRVREADGTVHKLVEDQRSILHHLSKLRFRMSRLYLVGPVEKEKLTVIKNEVRAWATL